MKTSIHSLERQLRPITSAFSLFIATEGTLRYVNFPCVPRVVMHVGRCEPYLMNQHMFNSFLSGQDILQNEDLDMDMMFIASLVSDLIKVSSLFITSKEI